jgi:hypothetical protein
VAGNKLTPFCAVFSGDGRDSVALSKRRKREIKAILEDDVRQALTNWTGATRRAKDERFLQDSESGFDVIQPKLVRDAHSVQIRRFVGTTPEW